MKTIKLAALALIIGGFTASLYACSNNSEESDDKTASADNKEVAPVDTSKVQGKGFAPTINIRFIDVERVYREYTYAAQEIAKIQKMEVELQQYQNALATKIQKKGNDIQQKANSNGYITPQSYEADMKEFNQLQQSSEQQYAARAQKSNAEAQKITAAVDASINNYIVKYNETHKYDAILPKAVGIYYNPSLDITDEIITGLNNSLKTTTTTTTTTPAK